MLLGCVAARLLAPRLLLLGVRLALVLALLPGLWVLAVLDLAFLGAFFGVFFEAIAFVLGWRHFAGRLAPLLLLGRRVRSSAEG